MKYRVNGKGMGVKKEAAPAPRKPMVRGSTPYRIVRRLLKMGPLPYAELSKYIAGSRMLRRDKYIDPSILSLRRRGFIRLSDTGDGKRWTVTQEGRLGIREATDSVLTIQARHAATLARSVALHQEHVRRQEIMGIPPELIHATVLEPSSPTVGL